MNTIKFLVNGSTGNEYEVTFYKTDKSLAATCTCPAAEKGTYCKHRFEILKGETSRLKTTNKGDVVIVLNWYKKSPLEEKVNLIRQLEDEQQALSSQISKEKKELARMFQKAS